MDLREMRHSQGWTTCTDWNNTLIRHASDTSKPGAVQVCIPDSLPSGWYPFTIRLLNSRGEAALALMRAAHDPSGNCVDPVEDIPRNQIGVKDPSTGQIITGRYDVTVWYGMKYDFSSGPPPRQSKHVFSTLNPQYDIFAYWPKSRWQRTPDFHKVLDLDVFDHKIKRVSSIAVKCDSNNNCHVVDLSDYGVVVWGLFSALRFRHFSYVSDNVYGMNLDVTDSGSWKDQEISLADPMNHGLSLDLPVWRISLHAGTMLTRLLSKETDYISAVLGAGKPADTLESASRYIMVRRGFSWKSMEDARQDLPYHVWPVGRQFYWDHDTRSHVLPDVMAEYKKGIALGMFAGHSNLSTVAQLISMGDVLNPSMWGNPPVKPVFYVPTACRVAEFQESLSDWLNDEYIIGEAMLLYPYTPVGVVGHTLTYVAAGIYDEFMHYLVNPSIILEPNGVFFISNAPARLGDAHLFAMANGLSTKCGKRGNLLHGNGFDVTQWTCGSDHLYLLEGLGDPTLPMNMGVDRDGDQYRWDQDLCAFDPDESPPLDPDHDGIGTVCDNCPDMFNPDQDDLDGDGTGDVCQGTYVPPVRVKEGVAKAGVLVVPSVPVKMEGLGPGRYRVRVHVPGVSRPKVPLNMEILVTTGPFSIIYDKAIKHDSDEAWTHTFTVTSSDKPITIEFIARIGSIFPPPSNLTCEVPVTITTWNEGIPMGFGMDEEMLGRIVDVENHPLADSLTVVSRKDMGLAGRVMHLNTPSGNKGNATDCPLYLDMGLESSSNFSFSATIGTRTLKPVDYPGNVRVNQNFYILPANGPEDIIKIPYCNNNVTWKQNSDDVLRLDVTCTNLPEGAKGLVFCMPDTSDVYLDKVEVKTW